jgi:hypothetical protein
VTVKSKAMPKLADRGIQCMFVGYAKEHAGDCYEMWNPVMGHNHVTRDIIWLRRMFYAPAPTTFPLVSYDHVAVVIPVDLPYLDLLVLLL